MQNGDKADKKSPRRRSRSPKGQQFGASGAGAGAGAGGRRDQDDAEGSNSSSDFQSDDDYAWIPWFCSLKGNEFFCEVDEAFAQDGFNLTGLNQLVPYYDYALDMVLDIEPNPEDVLSEEQQEMVENDAENLYGLIHARYILTNAGLHAMLEKYRAVHFGRCPRVLCRGHPTLPCGVSDTVNQEAVKVYCPRCEEMYSTKSARHDHVDGAYFGTTFPHLFFLTFPELKVGKSADHYVPRVFGFRVNKNAYKRSLEARKKEKAEQRAASQGTLHLLDEGGGDRKSDDDEEKGAAAAVATASAAGAAAGSASSKPAGAAKLAADKAGAAAKLKGGAGGGAGAGAGGAAAVSAGSGAAASAKPGGDDESEDDSQGSGAGSGKPPAPVAVKSKGRQ